MPSRNQPSASIDGKTLIQALAIVMCGFFIFYPMLHGDWVSDDNLYIVNNPLLKDPSRIWRAWFQPGSFVEYYPMQETFQWLEWKCFGLDPFGYHLTNLILHIASGFLIWRLFAKLRIPLAWLGGLLFVIHPMNVESVSWVSELKNTLSLPPFLLAMCSFIDYVENRRPRDYWLTLGFFLFAMFCKITMAAFPVVMLLYVWWKNGSIRRNDVLGTLPFFAISLVLGYATIWAGYAYAEHNFKPNEYIAIGGPISHIALSGTILFFYLAKCIWPYNPLPVYPQWSVDPPSFWQFLPWPIMAAVAIWCWINRTTWGRHVLLGLGFFILIIAPFLGLNEVSYMKAAWVYDHFLYIPMIGIIGLVVAGLGHALASAPETGRRVAYGAATIVAGCMIFVGWSYASIWTSEDSLNTYDLKRNPTSWIVQYNTGASLGRHGQDAEAIEHYLAAIKFKPDYPNAYYNLGNSLTRQHQFAEAIDRYHQTLKIDPNYAEAEIAIGLALVNSGDSSGAIDQYEATIGHRPACWPAYIALGDVYAHENLWDEAAEQYKKAATLNPDDATLRSNLGVALLRSGQTADGVEQLKKSLALNPDNYQLEFNLGLAYWQMKQTADAMDHFKAAVRLRPDDPQLPAMLARLGIQLGQD